MKYARTRERAEEVLRAAQVNAQLQVWWAEREELCATYALLERGVHRLGTVTSNSSEQMGSALRAVREQPVLDMVTSLIARMSDASLHRARIARGLIEDGKQLTPYVQEKHARAYRSSKKLFVEPEQNEGGVHEYVVRANPVLRIPGRV